MDIPKDILNIIATLARADNFADKVMREAVRCKYVSKKKRFDLQIKVDIEKAADVFMHFKIKSRTKILPDVPLYKQEVYLTSADGIKHFKDMKICGCIIFRKNFPDSIICDFDMRETKLRQMLYDAQEEAAKEKIKPALCRKSILLLCMMIEKHNRGLSPATFLKYAYYDLGLSGRGCLEFKIETEGIEMAVRINISCRMYKQNCGNMFKLHFYDSPKYITYRGKEIEVFCGDMIGIEEEDIKLRLYLADIYYEPRFGKKSVVNFLF